MWHARRDQGERLDEGMGRDSLQERERKQGRKRGYCVIEEVDGALAGVVGALDEGDVSADHAGVGLAIILAQPHAILLHNLQPCTVA